MVAISTGGWLRRVVPALALAAAMAVLPGVAAADWGCPNDCSGHGSCSFEGVFNPERKGWPWSRVCRCDPGWTSIDCSLCSSGEACSGRKVCRFGSCRCPIGWQGDDCDKCYSSVACGAHGSCFEEACVCEPGWSGRECDVPLDRGAR